MARATGRGAISDAPFDLTNFAFESAGVDGLDVLRFIKRNDAKIWSSSTAGWTRMSRFRSESLLVGPANAGVVSETSHHWPALSAQNRSTFPMFIDRRGSRSTCSVLSNPRWTARWRSAC